MWRRYLNMLNMPLLPSVLCIISSKAVRKQMSACTLICLLPHWHRLQLLHVIPINRSQTQAAQLLLFARVCVCVCVRLYLFKTLHTLTCCAIITPYLFILWSSVQGRRCTFYTLQRRAALILHQWEAVELNADEEKNTMKQYACVCWGERGPN